MKTKQYRNERGQFARIPLGLTAYFSKITHDGGPDYASGDYIVVGRGEKGIITVIPYQTKITGFHPKNLIYTDWYRTDEKIMTPKELRLFARKIYRDVANDTTWPNYHQTAKDAAYKFEQIAKTLDKLDN